MYVYRRALSSQVLTLAIASLVLWFIPAVASADIGTDVGKFIYEAVVAGTGTLLSIATFLFDAAVTHFVWGFGDYYLQYFGGAIQTAWAVVRDLMNFMFIFGLIYIGFRFILNADDQKAKSNLVMLIMAALLVNFSLFFAKAVIDISHLTAQQLQAPIETTSGQDVSFGNALLNSLQIGSIFSDQVAVENVEDFMWLMGLTVVSGALLLIAAFTLASLGILLFTRFIYLCFLLIFSPVMFIGWVFPGLSGWSKKWMETFLRQAFLAPALILSLYISLSLIALVGEINGVNQQGLLDPLSATESRSGGDNPQAMGDDIKGAIPFFILGIGFFIGSLVVAKQMGAAGAGAVISVGKNIGGRARGMAQRGARTGMRGATATVRYPARMATNAVGESLDRGFQNLQTRDSRLGRFARSNTVDRLARGATQAAAGARFGTVATNEENREYQRNIQSRANQREAANQRREEFESSLTALENTGATANELNDSFNDLQNTIRDMTTEEKQKLSHEKLTNAHVALNLDDKDIEGLENSGRFSGQQIQEIRTARNNARTNVARNGSTLDPARGFAGNTPTLHNRQRENLVNRSPQEVGKMPVDIFTDPNMAEQLTPQMVEQRMRNGNISNHELTTIRNNIDTYITNPATPDRVTNLWQNWTNNSTYGAQLGL